MVNSPSIPEEEVFDDVRRGQHDAEGEVDGEGVFEQRPLADPDEGFGPIHVEIPTLDEEVDSTR